MWVLYSVFFLRSPDKKTEPNIQHHHPLEKFTQELFLKRVTEKALSLISTIHVLIHIFNTFVTEKNKIETTKLQDKL